MASCYAYVDGQYFREELKKAGKPDEFNPGELAHNSVSGVIVYSRGQTTVRRVFYYDAIGEEQSEETARQREYLRWIQGLDDTHVVEGKLRRGRSREQKGVDISLAVDALRAAYQGVVDVVAILAGDADFAPLVKALRDAGPHVIVVAFESNAAADLVAAADRVVYVSVDQPFFRFREDVTAPASG